MNPYVTRRVADEYIRDRHAAAARDRRARAARAERRRGRRDDDTTARAEAAPAAGGARGRHSLAGRLAGLVSRAA